LSKIARRKFIQLSAVAAAGVLVQPGRSARAEDIPASRANSAEVQNCANCALAQGEDQGGWLQCQIFPGKLVNANGWCSVWAPKS
jgi:hypothetical protein